jgi:hypothetical protein
MISTIPTFFAQQSSWNTGETRAPDGFRAVTSTISPPTGLLGVGLNGTQIAAHDCVSRGSGSETHIWPSPQFTEQEATLNEICNILRRWKYPFRCSYPRRPAMARWSTEPAGQPFLLLAVPAA